MIVDGRIFVVRRKSSDGYGTVLHALDAGTGNDLWTLTLGEEFPWAGTAYGGGRLYAVNAEGRMFALDPRSGTVLWAAQMPEKYAFSSEPTYSQGVVYTGGAGVGGTLYAVEAGTGSLLWSRPVANGSASSPAVDGARVYVSYECPNVYAFQKRSGSLEWEHRPGCSGGGGRTPVLHDQRLYVRDGPGSGFVFDARSGDLLGGFPPGPAPAFAGDRMVSVEEGGIQTRATKGGAPLWTWSAREDPVVLPPLVVGSHVLAATASGTVRALRLREGTLVWTGSAGAAVRSHDDLVGLLPSPALAAGDGLQMVPAGSTLTAFAFRRRSLPAPGQLVLEVSPKRLAYGGRARVTARLPPRRGSSPRPVIEIQFNERSDGRGWQRARRGRIGPRGYYRTELRLRASGRLRGVARLGPRRRLVSPTVRVRVRPRPR